MLDVGYATATPDAVAGFVAARYALGPIQGVRLLNRGFNDIYTVQAAAGRFIVRLSGLRGRGPADVADETRFLAHLVAQGVPVAAAVPLADGALWSMATLPDGERAAVLFQEAEGRVPGLDSPPDAAAQGRTLAALHDAAESYAGRGDYTLDAGHLLLRPLAAIRALPFEAPEAMRDLDALAARLMERLRAIEPTLAVTRCHGDCHGLNARIVTEGPRAGQAVFFDFDDGGRGFVAYDLAVHLWAQVSFGRTRQAIWHAFLAGYREVRALAPADLHAIELFVPFRHLWLMGGFADQTARWGGEFLTPAWVAREAAFLLAWERDRIAPPLL